ncbi:MAG: FmdC precursor [Reichenbachiella sp.]
MRKYLTIFAVVCLCTTVKSQSFEGTKIGNGIRFTAPDSSFSVQSNIRFQTQYAGVRNQESHEYTDQFTIRRFRLKFKGYLVDPKIGYKIELALSNRDQGDFYAENGGAASIVLDAVLKWKFAPGWQLWVGQTKLPGNRERVISSGQLQLVDRSRLNSRFTIDRDKGLWLHHEHNLGGSLVLREIVSVTSGEGRNVTVSNESGYDYTGRIEILPFGKFTKKGDYFGGDLMREPRPKLAIGVTYDHNIGTNRERGQLGRFIFNPDGSGERSDLSTIFADAMFKYKGFTAMYEYANKKVADGDIYGLDTSGNIRYFYTGEAHNIQTGYLFKSNWSIDARFTDIQPSAIAHPEDPSITHVDDPERRYQVGWSKYIGGHNLKLQGSVAYRDRLTKDDETIYLLQLEIGF